MKNVSTLPLDIYQREKVITLLTVRPFEITPDVLHKMKSYWMEDILMIKTLHKLGRIDYVSALDGKGTCVKIEKNPGVKQIGPRMCGYKGICQVFAELNFCFYFSFKLYLIYL